MSNSSETTSKSKRAARRKDRRDTDAPRLQYEALVEVGAEAGGFEAESLDVSLDGMRMRTAYLPDLGQTLTCRFDGFGGEIVVEAEVVWCKAEARGGEFGIRFVGLDAHALTLLNDLCSPDNLEDEEEEPEEASSAAVGNRVRLHIEGLGSPMRARVRDAAHGEVLIGSNLEFLKVGRGVELEDVEQGRKRIAHIEHVGVEVDPESNVPQLVVALSYEPALGEADEDDEYTDAVHGELTTAPYRTKVAATQEVQESAESTPEPTVIDQSERPSDIELDEGAGLRVAHAPPASVDASDPEQDFAPEEEEFFEDEQDEQDEVVAGSRVAARRATEKVGAIARRLGPKLVSAGSIARGKLGSVISNMSAARKRHSERRQAKVKSKAPKRVTAPPPSSAVRNGGRRQLRGQRSQRPRTSDQPVSTDVETPEVETIETSGRKRTILTAAMAAAAVVAIYFVSTHVRGMVDASPDAAVAAASAAATGTPELPGLPGAAPGDATANVPLFGATPLSTTEAVPAPPAPGESAPEPGAATDGGSASDKPSASTANLATEWGVGEVEEPTVLRLKMDGKIAGISGSETASGFTIVVPNRKSVSSAAGLARKDKRIDSVNVVNYPDRAEVTIHFKKDVPAFNVQAKGKRLIVEIATAKKKKKKSKKKKKKK